jgi:glutamate-ammonia-ligase adenylyltransferase
VDEVRAEVRRQGGSVDEVVFADFLSRLPRSYLDQASPAKTARHLLLATTLGAGRRARVSVVPADHGRYEVSVVAFDYFAELSIVCGLLAAHGLDIEAGHVHTLEAPSPPSAAVPARGPFPRPRARPSGPGRRIVDVFEVRPLAGQVPEPERLERELVALLDEVAEGRGADAREALNLRLVEAIERAGPVDPGEGDLEIRFVDDAGDPGSTLLEVEGRDAPGFLYALTNALAMRGIYIHEVQIASAAGRVHDRFRIARAAGGGLEAGEEREALRTTIALIQQFTRRLPGTPDPGRALRYFDQFLDRAQDLAKGELEAIASPEGLKDLARLLGSSSFLWEDVLRHRFLRFLPALAGWRAPLLPRAVLAARLRDALRKAPPEERPAVVRDFRDEQALRIEVRRVLDPGFDLAAFSSALAELGDALVEELVRAVAEPLRPTADDASDPLPALAVFGLGKFGGREMGYASDLELLFVYEGPEAGATDSGPFADAVVRGVQAWLDAPEGSLFHVDLRLRPHGAKGPLASPLSALAAYYRPGGGAAPFERQALLKLRPVAGPPALVEAVLAVRDAFVWSGEPWDRNDALRLRERQARELVPPGRFNVKLSPGGLVDAEYAVQYLQILHGGDDPGLRTPSTLQALDRLAETGRISPAEHDDLRLGYLFWRQVADALRIVRGHAADLLLPDEGSDALGFLARRLGYPGGRAEAAAALDADVDRHRLRLRAFYDARFR